jgi:upstream activation factor subunit UAF30
MTKKLTGITAPKKISRALAAVIGRGPVSRGDVMKKIWIYIKKQKGMQDGRNINLNDELKELFNTKIKVISMFDLAKLLSPHIENSDGEIASEE